MQVLASARLFTKRSTTVEAQALHISGQTELQTPYRNVLAPTAPTAPNFFAALTTISGDNSHGSSGSCINLGCF